jgi:hypothetical protein
VILNRKFFTGDKMKRYLKSIALLATLVVSDAAFANEFRAPLTTERGPLRYDFKNKKDDWSLNVWSGGYQKSANKTFIKHGTDSSPLTKLFFGKDNFTISEAFQDADPVKHYTQNRNPYLGTTKIAPRASYTERGMTLGARFEYPVWQNKGRVGLRGNVPFKTIRMERDDEAENVATGLQNAVVNGDSVSLTDNSGSKVVSGISRYRARLLNALRRVNDAGQYVSMFTFAAAASPSGIGGTQYDKDTADIPDKVPGSIPAVFMVRRGGHPPIGDAVPVTSDKNVSGTNIVGATDIAFGTVEKAVVCAKNIKTGANSKLIPLNPDADADSLDQNRGYIFDQSVSYEGLDKKPVFDDLWVVPVFTGATPSLAPEATKMVNLVNSELLLYRSGIYEFMKAYGGFEFQSTQKTGLGDIDLEAFYEHTFSDDWRGEVALGVRLPTGGSSKYDGNPYRVRLGNGNHFEIKAGGLLAMKAFDWMHLKADAYYSLALQSVEKRATAFKGATIKNVGMGVDADVDYGYFTGHLDATFFHPQTNDLSTTFGYELYFKSEDTIKFKEKDTANHMLGKAWGDGTTKSELGVTAGTEWMEYKMDLDNKVAEKNTEQIAHRFRFESTYKAHKYATFYVGGAYTFAGQNMPRETDMHGGMNIKF